MNISDPVCIGWLISERLYLKDVCNAIILHQKVFKELIQNQYCHEIHVHDNSMQSFDLSFIYKLIAVLLKHTENFKCLSNLLPVCQLVLQHLQARS